ncbi:S8 family peptidase [Arthrobacter sp. 2RAF6]|uniref:S8 family peptidase n=1 Tax=Arthrobacter sp. 2RAF6 TaxID=3233002 RepID=UPI003F912C96
MPDLPRGKFRSRRGFYPSHGFPTALRGSAIACLAVLIGGSLFAAPASAGTDDPLPAASGLGVPAGPAHSLSGQSVAADSLPTDQFIVRFKDKATPSPQGHAEALGQKVGIAAADLRATAGGARVVKTARKLAAGDAEQFLASVRADPNVEYAEPDVIMRRADVTPNDPYYPLQWNLQDTPQGMRLPGAWAVNRGAGVVVAVIDTGITSHSDLNANVLPGYDMVSDAAAARDGDGRDANARDEGDWVVDGQCGTGELRANSSWHGTHVAGIIAAAGNNAKGISGVAPQARILPVRALGACGGYTSDVADGIIWAAGGTVSGAPVNPNPARVINLSLGTVNPCSATTQSAINFAYNAGAAVTVAAGNSNRDASDFSPANCQNVIAVAASGYSGSRTPYSNYGPAIDVMASGGQMTNFTEQGILSTYNTGATTPGTETYAYGQGTSMAAPHVAGVVALMMAEKGSTMTPEAAELRLKATTIPGGCPEGCGAGLMDAAAAMNFVNGSILVPLTPLPVQFRDDYGADQDFYDVQIMRGVDYLLDGEIIGSGSHAGRGTVTVSARAWPGYALTGTTEWTHTFAVLPTPAKPDPVVFTDKDGTAQDTYTIPTTTGLEYLIGGVVAAAGTYPGSGTVTVVPRALPDYALARGYEGTSMTWTFKSTYAPVSGSLVPTPPFRALDTRSRVLDGRFGVPVGPDSTVSFQVAGVNGIPADVSAVVFNLTVAEAKSFGYITAYPSGATRPDASNVNFTAGQIVPNSVTVPVGADGKVTLFNRSAGATHLLADISGYYLGGTPTAAGTFQPVSPSRFLDTRNFGAVPPDSAVSFQVAGTHGIPAKISAVVFNLTVAEARAFGYITAYASGTTRPNASNVNFAGGQIVPNSVTVPVGADGKVTLFNRSDGATHLLADVSGYYLEGTPTVGGALQPLAPSRFLDTRLTAPVGSDSIVEFQVGGLNGIPADAAAVVFNLTVADAKSFGYVTAYPAGSISGVPNVSSVNFKAGQIVPNSVTVPVGPYGKVGLYNRSSGATPLLADVSGYFLPG